MNRSSSTRWRREPIPPILISSSAWVTTSAPILGVAHLPRRPQDRLDDVLVAGAAAQVARQPPADVVLRGVGTLVEQGLGGEHHARRAESALQAVLVLEPLLQRVQLAGAAEPLDRGDLVPVGLDREHGAALDRTAVEQ